MKISRKGINKAKVNLKATAHDIIEASYELHKLLTLFQH